MNDPMTRPPNQREKTGARDPSRMEVGRVRLTLIFCLAVVIAGWSANSLLVANDRVLGFFIDVLLPVFEWLLRLPEHFIS